MKLNEIREFLTTDIWRIDDKAQKPAKRLGINFLKRVIITVEMFINHNLASYTAALTYSCILAAVPVLSIILAIARGFGFGNMIEDRLRSNVQMSPEIIDTVMNFIDSYLARTRGGIFVGVGLIILLYTVVMLTSNIETAFNTIWRVRSPRNIYRRITDYVSIFLILPILIVVTSGFSIFIVTVTSQFADYVILSSTMEFMIKGAPVIISGLAFAILYKLMPNTHVKWRAVIAPGFIAGVLFQLVQYYYIHYQIMLSSYNAVYGSFAALPMFMLWLQISWYICLIGGQMCYANQCADEYSFAKDSQHLSRKDHDALALLLMKRICKRFEQGATPYTAHELSNDTNIPQSKVNGLLEELVAANMLSTIVNETGTDTHYQPSQDINKMTVNWVIRQIDAHGRGKLGHRWSKKNKEWDNICQTRASLAMRNEDLLVKDL